MGKKSNILETVKSFDMFAETVSFNVGRGRQKHGTLFGTLMTVVILICMAIYAANKLGRLIDYQDTKYMETTEEGFEPDKKYSLKELNMELVVQIVDFVTLSTINPADIGVKLNFRSLKA